jgi:hypothetical protein
LTRHMGCRKSEEDGEDHEINSSESWERWCIG